MNILQKFYIPSFSPKIKKIMTMAALPILAVIVFMLSLTLGASEASIIEALRSLFQGDCSGTDFKIIFYIRLPRVLAALLGGAALSVSGVIIQGVLNNPMAAPNIIGVNSGAGFFVILVMALMPTLTGYLPLAAFLGALFASLIIYAISTATGSGRVTVILVGAAMGSILTACINTVKSLFPDSVYDVSGFLIGGLAAADLGKVLPAAIMIVPTLIIVYLMSGGLDVLSLGTEVASSLGMRVKRARFVYLALASVLAGAAVSFGGLIGFVGLLVPHIMRRLVGNTHKVLIPAAALGGGVFLLVADTISRTAFAPYELPVGILMSLVGGPFFIFLIFAERRRGE